MLFYLTSNERVNLLDFAEPLTGLIPKKMAGKFSLTRFVVRDMRNYAHIKYFAIDRAAAGEDDDGFIEAIGSLRTMFSARVIVICEGLSEHDAFLRRLIMAGVTDIVTASDIEAMQAEILECLSPEGMLRYKAPAPEPEAPVIRFRSESGGERYTFTAQNARIAVAGCQRRVGVTTTAANLAHWIAEHGGAACYIENNEHRHLSCILKLYAGEPAQNHYEIGGVDYYFTDEPDKDYNFIVYDCGELAEKPQAAFRDADLRLLCGSAMPYELVYLQSVVDRCKDLSVTALGMCVPEDIRELMQSAICADMRFMAPSHFLFDGTANSAEYKNLLKSYLTSAEG
jgi:hypothetical protein